MTDRPRLTSVDLWAQHESSCLGVLRAALARLDGVPKQACEVDINRRLFFELVRASHDAHFPVAPIPEGLNPPSPSDAERAAREHKRPDFYWAYIDDLAADPYRAAKQFVVECKRLAMGSRTWVYTEQYVRSGVVRYISPDHGYGKDVASGAMVGYLHGLSLATALSEVNAWANADAVPELRLLTSDGDRAELEHALERTFAESPFRLLHVWAKV